MTTKVKERGGATKKKMRQTLHSTFMHKLTDPRERESLVNNLRVYMKLHFVEVSKEKKNNFFFSIRTNEFTSCERCKGAIFLLFFSFFPYQKQHNRGLFEDYRF